MWWGLYMFLMIQQFSPHTEPLCCHYLQEALEADFLIAARDIWWPHGESICMTAKLPLAILHIFVDSPVLRHKEKETTDGDLFFLVTSRRIELRLPGWKPGVLTVRRWGHEWERYVLCLYKTILRANGLLHCMRPICKQAVKRLTYSTTTDGKRKSFVSRQRI